MRGGAWFERRGGVRGAIGKMLDCEFGSLAVINDIIQMLLGVDLTHSQQLPCLGSH